MQEQQQQQLTVKAMNGDEIRRFSIPVNVTWKDIIGKLSALFSIQPDSLLVKYEDDEKELITINSDSELQEAIRVYQQVLSKTSDFQCLRLIIFGASSSSSSDAVQNAAPHQECGRGKNKCWKKKEKGFKHPHHHAGCSTVNREELRAKLLQLEEMGFKCKMRNIRLLKMHDGDVDKVIQVLSEQQEKRKSYAEALEKLKQQGFDKQRINLILLDKFEGDVEKVSKLLKASKELEEKGYKNTLFNVKLLNRFDCDVQKVEEVWKQWREKFIQKRQKFVEKKLEKVEKKEWKKGGKGHHHWKQQQQQHHHQGLDWQKKGKHQCLKNKEKGVKQGEHPCANFNREEFRAKLLQLEEMGFKCKMRNIRLLKMHDGDVNKVVQFLSEKQQKRKSLKEALDQLTQQGFDKQGLNLILLRKFEGDVEKVTKVLKALKELEEKGYNNPRVGIKLLIRFDCDVQKVEEIWKKRREHFNQKREKCVEKKLEKVEKKEWKKGRKQHHGCKHHKGDWKKKKWERENRDEKPF